MKVYVNEQGLIRWGYLVTMPEKDWVNHPKLSMAFWYTSVITVILALLSLRYYLDTLGIWNTPNSELAASVVIISLVLIVMWLSSCMVWFLGYPLQVWFTGKADLQRRNIR